MSKELSRKEKVKVLLLIKDGKISHTYLKDQQVYFFIERSSNPGVYEYNGKEIDTIEFRRICDEIHSNNKKAIIWKEWRQYSFSS